MKHKFLNKLLLLLLCILGGANSAWADTSALTFTAACGGSGTADNGASWTVTSDGTESSHDSSKGIHYGTGSAEVTYIQLSTSDISGTITKVVVNASTASGVTATVSVNVGDAAFGGDAQSLTTSAANYTFNGSASGEIVVRVAKPSKAVKALYVKSVTVTYSTATGEETTTTIDDSGITNTNKFVSTEAGSLSASVTYGSPASAVPAASVTWSGDDDDVATINATTGAVTLVGAGTVTFTATYAGVDDEYQPSSKTYEMTVTNEDPDIETIWSENFSTFNADDVPDGGTYGYVCVDGSSDTKIYKEYLAGGVSPELLVGKSGGSFSATIPLLHPTYGYSGDLTLTFKANNTNVAISTSTVGVTVSGSVVSGTSTLTLSGVTTSMENVVITFTNSYSSSNVRIDDIVLKGKKTALTVVATPSISPASGAVVSGTEITMTCATAGATIYYTTNGDTPTSSSTAYDPESKPTITSACTIKAIGIKAGLTDSDVASVSYTIAAPCATPTFSVAEGVVDKGTIVSLSCATDDATIYYTTNGTTPTTSSSVYSSSLTINASQTIKAIAAKDGYANSEVASATYTVRDYVNYPFSWDDTSTPTGVTNSGVGTYASSPYLKFDGSGDYIILKTNAAPGELKYDIIGNSFSGGTFKVQYSADGSSYTDLKSYTGISSSKTTETFTNIPATTRYIKWVYVTKSSGNVGLGNIKLTGCESVIVGDAGYTTYTTTGKVCFPEGVTGYIVTSTTASTVELTSKESVPASTPIVLKASKATYYLPVITSTPESVTGNLLESSDGTVTGGTGIYALGKKSGTVGFYLVDSSVTIPEGKAYLDLSGSPVKEFLTFDFGDEPDGIETVDNRQQTTDNSPIYNLAGQRLQKMQKGINIVNGKKILK